MPSNPHIRRVSRRRPRRYLPLVLALGTGGYVLWLVWQAVQS